MRNMNIDAKFASVERKPEGLPQERIMQLLNEAADPGCDGQRLAQIQVELSDAITRSHERTDGQEGDTRQEGIEVLINTVLVQAFQHDRTLLPKLFPLFAAACGERSGMIVADINWEQYKI